MKISEEILGCLGAVTLMLLLIALEGLLFWGLGRLIIWAFGLKIAFHYWQALIIGFVFDILTSGLRKSDK